MGWKLSCLVLLIILHFAQSDQSGQCIILELPQVDFIFNFPNFSNCIIVEGDEDQCCRIKLQNEGVIKINDQNFNPYLNVVSLPFKIVLQKRNVTVEGEPIPCNSNDVKGRMFGSGIFSQSINNELKVKRMNSDVEGLVMLDTNYLNYNSLIFNGLVSLKRFQIFNPGCFLPFKLIAFEGNVQGLICEPEATVRDAKIEGNSDNLAYNKLLVYYNFEAYNLTDSYSNFIYKDLLSKISFVPSYNIALFQNQLLMLSVNLSMQCPREMKQLSNLLDSNAEHSTFLSCMGIMFEAFTNVSENAIYQKFYRESLTQSRLYGEMFSNFWFLKNVYDSVNQRSDQPDKTLRLHVKQCSATILFDEREAVKYVYILGNGVETDKELSCYFKLNHKSNFTVEYFYVKENCDENFIQVEYSWNDVPLKLITVCDYIQIISLPLESSAIRVNIKKKLSYGMGFLLSFKNPDVYAHLTHDDFISDFPFKFDELKNPILSPFEESKFDDVLFASRLPVVQLRVNCRKLCDYLVTASVLYEGSLVKQIFKKMDENLYIAIGFKNLTSIKQLQSHIDRALFFHEEKLQHVYQIVENSIIVEDFDECQYFNTSINNTCLHCHNFDLHHHCNDYETIGIEEGLICTEIRPFSEFRVGCGDQRHAIVVDINFASVELEYLIGEKTIKGLVENVYESNENNSFIIIVHKKTMPFEELQEQLHNANKLRSHYENGDQLVVRDFDECEYLKNPSDCQNDTLPEICENCINLPFTYLCITNYHYLRDHYIPEFTGKVLSEGKNQIALLDNLLDPAAKEVIYKLLDEFVGELQKQNAFSSVIKSIYKFGNDYVIVCGSQIESLAQLRNYFILSHNSMGWTDPFNLIEVEDFNECEYLFNCTDCGNLDCPNCENFPLSYICIADFNESTSTSIAPHAVEARAPLLEVLLNEPIRNSTLERFATMLRSSSHFSSVIFIPQSKKEFLIIGEKRTSLAKLKLRLYELMDERGYQPYFKTISNFRVISIHSLNPDLLSEDDNSMAIYRVDQETLDSRYNDYLDDVFTVILDSHLSTALKSVYKLGFDYVISADKEVKSLEELQEFFTYSFNNLSLFFNRTNLEDFNECEYIESFNCTDCSNFTCNDCMNLQLSFKCDASTYKGLVKDGTPLWFLIPCMVVVIALVAYLGWKLRARYINRSSPIKNYHVYVPVSEFDDYPTAIEPPSSVKERRNVSYAGNRDQPRIESNSDSEENISL